MLLPLLGLLLLTHAYNTHAAYCHGRPDPSTPPNTNPITSPSYSFVSSVPNGALYNLQVDDATINVVHLWGTPYQRGYAHGQLLSAQISIFFDAVWSYAEQQVEHYLKNVSQPLAKQIADFVLDTGLDLTTEWTSPFTGTYFDEEIQGLSDASGVPYKQIYRVHMLGELTKGSCSMFGAWGEAVADKGGLLSMRALDWIMDGPFQDHSQLTVYHATNDTENSFVNIGWAGWVGSLSGVNDAQLSIHEIGVFFADSSFGAESVQGIPFTFVLRDILQFDKHRLDALSRLASAHRTCDLILGVGDGKDRLFNSIEYSASVCNIMDDTNMKPVNSTWHPRINNIIYYSKDWDCPGFNAAMAGSLSKLQGILTPQNAIEWVLPQSQTGNLHAYIADLVNMQLFVSFAAPSNSTSTNTTAYSRAYAQIDLSQLFAVQPSHVHKQV